jgi:hypothetical protein
MFQPLLPPPTGFFLNNRNILSVIAKPPTRLKEAMTKAIDPITCSVLVDETEKRIKTPKMVTADIAFVMDINGV